MVALLLLRLGFIQSAQLAFNVFFSGPLPSYVYCYANHALFWRNKRVISNSQNVKYIPYFSRIDHKFMPLQAA